MLEGKALVNTSANCDLEAMNGVQITPSSIFSLMKCWSISMCFVLSCCTGLCAILIVTLLSQYNLAGSSTFICGSFRRVLSHEVKNSVGNP